MAATSHPLATDIALEVLRDGGSAVDAAIAANAMLGLVEPTGAGIGGDLFAIVWDPERKELFGLNASGRSSASASLVDLNRRLAGAPAIPTEGPLPVTVPGCVSGWFALHERFGRLPMAALLEPAAGTARSGFHLTPVIADEWKSNVERIRSAPGHDAWSASFLRTYAPHGDSPLVGDTFRNPDLADTLGLLIAEGADGFYRGDVAASIARCVARAGGVLSRTDLKKHRADRVTPISTTYRDYEIWELPPNGQGLSVLQMLNILSFTELAPLDPLSAEAVHLFVEVKKQAFEDLAHCYADPDFFSVPLKKLLSRERAEEQLAAIRKDRAARAPTRIPGCGDTVYLSTADCSGMMVSLIQSNYVGMGSGLVPDGCGFTLQNRGALFCLDPMHPNAMEPSKRPFHTIIPAFATRNGRPVLAFGVMGGSMQPQGHVQILTHLIDYGKSLQEAGDALRWRHTGSSQPTGGVMHDGGEVLLESGYPVHTADALKKRGHRIRMGNGTFGGYQAIGFDSRAGVFVGASEIRKDGRAAGL